MFRSRSRDRERSSRSSRHHREHHRSDRHDRDKEREKVNVGWYWLCTLLLPVAVQLSLLKSVCGQYIYTVACITLMLVLIVCLFLYSRRAADESTGKIVQDTNGECLHVLCVLFLIVFEVFFKFQKILTQLCAETKYT